MIDNTFKLNEMAIVFYSFVQGTNNAHLRVLNKIADKLGVQNRNILPHFLARLFLFESEDLSTELYQFYYEHALRGLHVQSPVTRTKCVTLLSYLSRVRLEPILPLIPILARQNKDQYWELKGQLLILASNVLMQFNEADLTISEAGSKKGNPEGREDSKVEIVGSRGDSKGLIS